MYRVNGCACVSCQLTQHGDDDLHGHVAVLVDLVRTDQGVNDDDTYAELFDFVGHVLQKGIVFCDAFSGFCGQGDADVVFAVEEQPACHVCVLDVVVLHDAGQAQEAFAAGIFEVDDPDLCAFVNRLVQEWLACGYGHGFDHGEAGLADAASRCGEADVIPDVGSAVDPAPLGQGQRVEVFDRCRPSCLRRLRLRRVKLLCVLCRHLLGHLLLDRIWLRCPAFGSCAVDRLLHFSACVLGGVSVHGEAIGESVDLCVGETFADV